MGGISSIYIRPAAPYDDGGEVNEVARVFEMTLAPDSNTEVRLGQTVELMAEENAQLRCEMATDNQLSTNYVPDLIQPEIIDETVDEKIKRLEKTLMLERQEKWDAIKNSEKYRVDLVNCQRNLEKEIKYRNIAEITLKDLKRQLEAKTNLEGLGTFDVNGSFCSELHELNGTLTIADGRETFEVAAAICKPDRSASQGRTNLKTFRIQIQQLREARQKAIQEKALEMTQLKEDLRKERIIRESLQEKLSSQDYNGHSDYKMNKIQVANKLEEENNDLRKVMQQLKLKLSELNTQILQQQNDYIHIQRENRRYQRDQQMLEKEKNEAQAKAKALSQELSNIWHKYDEEKEEIIKRTCALHKVIDITKQMLSIREKQVSDLKTKLEDIDITIEETNNLKAEYEKQLQNIKSLKELYEERISLMEAERIKLTDKISDDARVIDDLKNELSDLTYKYEIAADEVDCERQRNLDLSRQLTVSTAQARACQRELSAINNLLTQMLLGPSSDDLDHLAEQLQQNHALIAQITTCEDCSDVAAALPKLLLDLIAQVDEREKKEEIIGFDLMNESTDTISEQSDLLPVVSYKNATIFKSTKAQPTELQIVVPCNRMQSDETQVPSGLDPAVQEIVTNLPKVWRVLTELLSHHSPTATVSTPVTEHLQCYKSVETPNGTRSVISVSNTFIRLKELILEKKTLVREVSRLKHLNAHLETRLDDQEKRLSTVQSELHKTWGVVGRMRAQHQQLHNNEKILRYELQEKRIMLGELRQELEHCREKWERARRKNNESETECRKLRKEFAARKARDAGLCLGQDSGESGFSDEHNESDEDADRSGTPSPVPFEDLEIAFQVPQEIEPDHQCCNVELTSPASGAVMMTCDIASSCSPCLDGGLLSRRVECEGTCDNILEATDLSTISSQTIENTNTILDEITAEPDGSHSLQEIIATDEDEQERIRARDARALRLQRLEEQCGLLVRKVDITSHKSKYLSNRLEELHHHYGAKTSTSNQMQDSSESECKSSSNQENNEDHNASAMVIAGERVADKEVVTGEACNSYFTIEAPILESTADVVPQPPPPPPPPPPLPARLLSDSLSIATFDERMAARDARLQRLEEQCSSLFGKVSSTVEKGQGLSDRLQELHESCIRAESRVPTKRSSPTPQTLCLLPEMSISTEQGNLLNRVSSDVASASSLTTDQVDSPTSLPSDSNKVSPLSFSDDGSDS